MKILFVTSLLFLVACGTTEQECSFVVDEICVTTQPGQSISVERLAKGFAFLQSEVPGLNLSKLALDNSVTMEYHNPDDWQSDVTGYNSYDRIHILYGEGPWDGCWPKYFTPVHELMHSVARHHLGASIGDNHEHAVTGFFALELHDDSVETKVWNFMRLVCKETVDTNDGT